MILWLDDTFKAVVGNLTSENSLLTFKSDSNTENAACFLTFKEHFLFTKYIYIHYFVECCYTIDTEMIFYC